MKEIKLSEKDQYIVWLILCWFERPLVTGKTKAMLSMPYHPKRHVWNKKYEKQILQRIVSIAESVKKHPEWLEE